VTQADGGDAGNPVSVLDVVPNTGTVTGGYRVRITGTGFTATTTRVFFGDNEATGLLLQTQGSVTVFVPATNGPGPVDLRVTNPAGEAVAPSAFTYFNALRVDAITPSLLDTAGGNAVTIRGNGFEPGQVFLLGGRPATEVLFAEDHASVTAVTPPHPPGRVDVEVLSRFGAAKLVLGARYVAPLLPTRVEPALGPLEGGNPVRVLGSGLTPDVSLTLGGLPARLVDWVGEDELLVEAPPGASAGAVDVVLEDGETGAVAVLEDAYAYVEEGPAPALLVVSPRSGPLSGGTGVHLWGTSLVGSAMVVEVGGQVVSGLTIESEGHLQVTTPPGTAAGPVDVTVRRGGLTLLLPGGFTYVEGPTLASLTPGDGPDTGGTAVTIRGTGLSSACQFALGGRPLVVTVEDSTVAAGTTPAGSPGPVSLQVSCPGAPAADLPGAFTYRASLEVLSVDPVRGAISGGTWVRVSGRGFASGETPRVLFDNVPASRVTVLGDSVVTAHAPPHGPGQVRVDVVMGEARAGRERAYTYYDPAFILGGVRNGPVAGSVNVTAYDPAYGVPVVEALAVVGTELGSQYTGFTDARGQVVLSGPDVVGALTVTVAHCNYSYVTLAGVNAADVTVYMMPMFPPRCGPPSPPPDPTPSPPLPPPPVIRGVVTGFSKELFDPANLGTSEIAAAFVTHTWPSPFSYPPYDWQMAPSQTVFVEGGEYVIPLAWRTGPMAVVAIAGIYNIETSEFRAAQVGFNRGLIADLGGVYEHRDVELTIPLTKRLTIQFPDAPYVPPETVGNIVIPYINLGGEGAHPVYGWERTGSNAETQWVLENFADAPADLFTFIAQFQTLSGGTPYSTVLQDGEGPLGPAVALTPLMGYPELLSPRPQGVMEQRTLRLKPPVGQLPSFYEFTFQTLDGTTWYAYMDGRRTKVILPRFPEYATMEYAPPNMPAGGAMVRVESVYVPGFDFNTWSYQELWGLARRAWSNMDARFVNSGD
jgi:hypothetical protein